MRIESVAVVEIQAAVSTSDARFLRFTLKLKRGRQLKQPELANEKKGLHTELLKIFSPYYNATEDNEFFCLYYELKKVRVK